MKNLKLERLNHSEDEVYNVASNAAYWQMCATFWLFFFNFYPFLYISVFYEGHVPVNSGWHTSCDVHAII